MKHTFNIRLVSLFALILAGGYSVASFEQVYGAKEEETEKKDKAEVGRKKVEFKKVDDKGSAAEKAPKRKEADRKAVEKVLEERVKEGPVKDIKLVVSKEDAGNVTRVKDETGKEILKIDLTEKAFLVGDAVIYQHYFSKNEVPGKPMSETVTVVLNKGGSTDLGPNFTKGKDGLLRANFSHADPILSDIIDFPRAKDGEVWIEITDVPQELLEKVKADVESKDFQFRYNERARDYSAIEPLTAYIGVMERLDIHYKGKGPEVYENANSGIRFFTGHEGVDAFFNHREGVAVVRWGGFDSSWLRIIEKERALFALEIDRDDGPAQKVMEDKYNLRPIYMNGKTVYVVSGDRSEIVKEMMEEVAFKEAQPSWILKMDSEQLNSFGGNLAREKGYDFMAIKHFPEEKPAFAAWLNPESLKFLDQQKPDKDGWIREGGVLVYRGDADGKGAYIYDKERGTLAVFGMPAIWDMLGKFDAYNPQGKQTFELLVDESMYREIKGRFIEGYDYTKTSDGKLRFQGLTPAGAHKMLTSLPFYQAQGYVPHKGRFSEAPVFMTISGGNFKPLEKYQGSPPGLPFGFFGGKQ